jgi:hypothetical protein
VQREINACVHFSVVPFVLNLLSRGTGLSIHQAPPSGIHKLAPSLLGQKILASILHIGLQTWNALQVTLTLCACKRLVELRLSICVCSQLLTQCWFLYVTVKQVSCTAKGNRIHQVPSAD